MSVADKIPVMILTGFLGSGKTTLLKQLTAQPSFRHSALIINELGEVGLDQLLVSRTTEQLTVIESGCLCCTVRQDLIDRLTDLLAQREQHSGPSDGRYFDRVIIETTGLADPLPVLHTLMYTPGIHEHFRISQVLTCVDAVNGLATLEQYPEACRQANVSDWFLVTKTDHDDALPLAAIRQRLAALNASARLLTPNHGHLHAAEVAQLAAPTMTSVSGSAVPPLMISDHLQQHGVRSYCLVSNEAADPQAILRWLEIMVAMVGEKLLRVKGLLKLKDDHRVMVIHSVQQVMSPPEYLEQWPSDDQRSRIVVIMDDYPAADIQRIFRHFAGIELA